MSLWVTLLCSIAISVNCLPTNTPPPAATPSVPRNSTPCSIDPSAVCLTTDASENYSMQLNTRHFHESGEIEGNVCTTFAHIRNAIFSLYIKWFTVDFWGKCWKCKLGPGIGEPEGCGLWYSSILQVLVLFLVFFQHEIDKSLTSASAIRFSAESVSQEDVVS